MKTFKLTLAALIMAAAIPMSAIPASAVKTVSEKGLRYSVSEDGSKELYTGWTRDKATGGRKYYRNGKRAVGWTTIDGKKYYLIRTGGIAADKFKIGDKLYTFGDDGVYTGEAVPCTGEYSTDISQVIHANVQYSNDRYAESYGGIKSDGTRYNRITVGITDEKYADYYKGITGGLVTVEKVKYSYNEKNALHKFVSDNCIKNSKYKVVSVGMKYDKVAIEVLTEENITAVTELLDEEGYNSDMYEISVGQITIPE